MAFGKNAQARAKVGSFRQQSAAYTKKGNFGGSQKRGLPYFIDMYKPSTDYVDTLRFLPGPFVDEDAETTPDGQVRIVPVQTNFKKFVEHFDGHMSKGAICSSKSWQSIEEQRNSCHGCDIFWETAERNSTGRLESSRMSRQNKYAFAVYDYGSYHKVPQTDRQTGQVKLNPRTKEPYFNWVKCQGQGCDMCRAGLEVKYGTSTHWPVNFTELQIIRAAEADIGDSCKTCQTAKSITSIAWLCQNCQECCIDMQSSNFKKDELLKMTDEPFQCPHCGQKDLLTEVYECSVCSSRGQQGARASLFDVDIQARYVQAGDKKVLTITGFSIPYPITAAEVQRWPGIDKPQDVVKRYQPDSLEYQADRFGVAPKAPGPQAPGPQAAPAGGRYPVTQPGPAHPGPGPMPGHQGFTPPAPPPQPQVAPHPAPQPMMPPQPAPVAPPQTGFAAGPGPAPGAPRSYFNK